MATVSAVAQTEDCLVHSEEILSLLTLEQAGGWRTRGQGSSPEIREGGPACWETRTSLGTVRHMNGTGLRTLRQQSSIRPQPTTAGKHPEQMDTWLRGH